jgi:hypothetical protein
MQVTSYQMRNVIDCFCKKLSQTRKQEQPQAPFAPKMTDAMALTPESSRKATMDKISEQVLNKINEAGGLIQPPAPAPKAELEGNSAAEEAGEHQDTGFTFNVIDAIDQKRTATLAVENTSALIRRLDQRAQAQRLSETESWV